MLEMQLNPFLCKKTQDIASQYRYTKNPCEPVFFSSMIGLRIHKESGYPGYRFFACVLNKGITRNKEWMP